MRYKVLVGGMLACMASGCWASEKEVKGAAELQTLSVEEKTFDSIKMLWGSALAIDQQAPLLLGRVLTSQKEYITGAVWYRAGAVDGFLTSVCDLARRKHMLVFRAINRNEVYHEWDTDVTTSGSYEYLGVISRSQYGYLNRISKNQDRDPREYPYRVITTIVPLSLIYGFFQGEMLWDDFIREAGSVRTAQFELLCYLDKAKVGPDLWAVSDNGQRATASFGIQAKSGIVMGQDSCIADKWNGPWPKWLLDHTMRINNRGDMACIQKDVLTIKLVTGPIVTHRINAAYAAFHTNYSGISVIASGAPGAPPVFPLVYSNEQEQWGVLDQRGLFVPVEKMREPSVGGAVSIIEDGCTPCPHALQIAVLSKKGVIEKQLMVYDRRETEAMMTETLRPLRDRAAQQPLSELYSSLDKILTSWPCGIWNLRRGRILATAIKQRSAQEVADIQQRTQIQRSQQQKNFAETQREISEQWRTASLIQRLHYLWYGGGSVPELYQARRDMVAPIMLGGLAVGGLAVGGIVYVLNKLKRV